MSQSSRTRGKNEAASELLALSRFSTQVVHQRIILGKKSINEAGYKMAALASASRNPRKELTWKANNSKLASVFKLK